MIRVKSLTFCYDAASEILKGISFEAEGGQLAAILGNNGAGKSTLVKCMNRILVPMGGSVYVNGENALAMRRRFLARRIAYVAQRTVDDLLCLTLSCWGESHIWASTLRRRI